ncbi:DMT family transporter [Merismopedia glauca]|uniref:EamA family transporter n=1 Tax=Merismopedia glauca CCAP 1448/3 TaxID=1296344 RepID=A0A2T1BWR9_9CYAN|nr:DMT family transporter [Merismopedia glauca]PSB00432.1 EamA family transporter [Merismopedia glauca CCAP 1448/3]
MALHHSSGNWRLGLGLSSVAVFLWGILPVGLAVTLQALDVYTIVWFRFIFAFVVLGIYLATKRQLPPIIKLRTIPGWLIAIAILGLAFNYLFFLQGLQQTSPSNAEVIIQLAVVLMGLGGLAIFKERYRLPQWIGLGVLILGFSLFFHEQIQVLVNASQDYLIGSGIIVLGAITWAAYSLAQKQLLQKLSSFQIMWLIYGSCALLFSPFAKPQLLLSLDTLHLGTLLFCAFNTLIAYGAFAESLEHWEASKVSAVLALAPILTILAMELVTWLVPNLVPPEHITQLGIVGAVLVVAGSVSIALGKQS